MLCWQDRGSRKTGIYTEIAIKQLATVPNSEMPHFPELSSRPPKIWVDAAL